MFSEKNYLASKFRHMKILVCEDNDVALKVIQLALKGIPGQTIIARDGRQALQALDAHPDVDLVITDIHMPFNNGDVVLDQIRNVQEKKTPIIMISSDANDDVIRIALNSGVNEFVEKPLDPDVLKSKVKKLLKLK
jgi:CheY-like chemotaxis protein